MENINKIYFDTDNLSEFLKHNKEHLLFELFGKNGAINITVQVKNELYSDSLTASLHPQALMFKNKIENYIELGYIKVAAISANLSGNKIFKELVTTHNMGEGEASCIALSTTTKNPMASNNYRDIGVFVRNELIDNYSATRILFECVNHNILSIDEACAVWAEFKDSSKSPGAKLPGDIFEDGLFSLVRSNEVAIEQVNRVWVKSLSMTALSSLKNNLVFTASDTASPSQLPTFYDHLNNMCESGVISVPMLDYVWQKNLHKFDYQQIEQTFYEQVIKSVQEGEMTIEEVEKFWIPNEQPERKPINTRYDNTMNESLKDLPTETFKELYEEAVYTNFEIFDNDILKYKADTFLKNTEQEAEVIKVVTDNNVKIEGMNLKKDIKETAIEVSKTLNIDPSLMMQNTVDMRPTVNS